MGQTNFPYRIYMRTGSRVTVWIGGAEKVDVALVSAGLLNTDVSNIEGYKELCADCVGTRLIHGNPCPHCMPVWKDKTVEHVNHLLTYLTGTGLFAKALYNEANWKLAPYDFINYLEGYNLIGENYVLADQPIWNGDIALYWSGEGVPEKVRQACGLFGLEFEHDGSPYMPIYVRLMEY